ncbi:MAG: helix-turn-helix transcriptional regulator [Myxococcaceae bacterium]|nr:helix-turn-helix transcriptional regulator [Myxococcaceae bacterium]
MTPGRARTLEDWLAAPAGRWFPGRCFVTFCPTPTLFGFALWGRPGRADIERLTRALLVELGPNAGPHRSLVDVRFVESVDGAAFEVLQRYVQSHHAALKERVTSLALVRPAGLVGAVVAGFYSVLDSPYPTKDFGTLGEAVRWLGLDADVGDGVAALVAEHSGQSPLLVDLHACLDALGPKAPMARIAKQLGVATRTLQRRLSEQRTSFAREVMAHRLRAARARMLETDEPLTAIALDCGFASLQHFSAAFRKAEGASPAQWRKARGAGR